MRIKEITSTCAHYGYRRVHVVEALTRITAMRMYPATIKVDTGAVDDACRIRPSGKGNRLA